MPVLSITKEHRARWQKETRKEFQQENETPCVGAVARFFGIAGMFGNTRYLHKAEDIVRGLRRAGYKATSCRAKLGIRKGKKMSVGACRGPIRAQDVEACYLVRVKGHVLLLNGQGESIVDTAPRKRDARRIIDIWEITK